MMGAIEIKLALLFPHTLQELRTQVLPHGRLGIIEGRLLKAFY
jgi:hypothetical protein